MADKKIENHPSTPTSTNLHVLNPHAPVHHEPNHTAHVKMEDQTPPTPEEVRFETKSLLIGAAVIIGLLLLIFLAIKIYPELAAKPMTITELHQQNLDGKLKPDQGIIYNGFSFIKLDGLWWGEVQVSDQLTRIRFHYNPKELENITITGHLNESFNNGSNVYLAVRPDYASKYYNLALSELTTNINHGIYGKVKAACTMEDDICVNRTIASCNNTQGLPVIELIPHDEAKVVLQGSCIGIYGNESDLTRASERVLYQLYGVMN